jgi:hypothetical protein
VWSILNLLGTEKTLIAGCEREIGVIFQAINPNRRGIDAGIGANTAMFSAVHDHAGYF